MDNEEFKLIYNKALDLISRREHSKYELFLKVKRKFPNRTNVIDNAYKFANAVININLISEKESIIIEVADDGPGFAPEIYPFLGEPYIKNNNKAEKQGLGLGLFISKNLLAKSNGQIKFSHRESGGGMVKIVLSKDQLDLLK